MCVCSWKDKLPLSAHFSQVVLSRFTFHLLDLYASPSTASTHLCQQDRACGACVFYKGQTSALLSSGLSLPIHRNLKEAKKWYDLSQVIWTGPYLVPAPTDWCFCNQSTLADQCLWTSVMAALSAMAINEVMSMLRFTIYIFCGVSAVG